MAVESPTWILSRRQKKLFRMVANVWRFRVDAVGDTVSPQGSYDLYYEGVPCFRDVHERIEEMHEGGRLEHYNIVNYDEWHFPEQILLADSYIFKDVTPGSRTNGMFWIANGEPSITAMITSRRPAGNVTIPSVPLVELPAGVS